MSFLNKTIQDYFSIYVSLVDLNVVKLIINVIKILPCSELHNLIQHDVLVL